MPVCIECGAHCDRDDMVRCPLCDALVCYACFDADAHKCQEGEQCQSR